MFLLSTIEHKKNITLPFSEHPYRDRDYYDTMFKQKPLSVKDDEYLINFGCQSKPKIRLGKVEDEKFIPNTSPFCDWEHNKEINYNNQNTDIVEDFIHEIMNYKLSNRKGTLEQEDINKILEKYGISYTSEMQKLANTLKSVNEKAVEAMNKTTKIGKVLCRKNNN